jgi:uncharacterized phage-associated protein
MPLRFDEAKATQSAAFLLKLRGGRMHYFKLIKLLYLVDRTALLRWGIPVTTDRYASMDHGPIVSNIYNLITKDVGKEVWSEVISPPFGEDEIRLLSPDTPPNDRLSSAEEKLMREVFDDYGYMNRWELRDYVMHKLPEWKDPHGSSTPIRIAAILKAGGESDDEIRAIMRELRLVGQSDETIPSV